MQIKLLNTLQIFVLFGSRGSFAQIRSVPSLGQAILFDISLFLIALEREKMSYRQPPGWWYSRGRRKGQSVKLCWEGGQSDHVCPKWQKILHFYQSVTHAGQIELPVLKNNYACTTTPNIGMLCFFKGAKYFGLNAKCLENFSSKILQYLKGP